LKAYIKKWNIFLSYLFIFLFTLVLGCASLTHLPPAKPFSQKESDRIISKLRDQEKKVLSFQGIGKVMIKKGEEEIEANLFAVGSNPYKIRLEITHSWGRPLIHIVADEKIISVLSLTDKKFFRGPSHSLNKKQFFLYGLDLDLVWKIFSGNVPIPSASGRIMSLRPHEISFYNEQDEIVETICFSSKTLLPQSINFPKKGLSILLSEFDEGSLGPHPLKIKVLKEREEQLVVIRYKKFTFNKPVPEEIFQLNPPPSFEIINLNNS
jgi:outer membrane lipoprotein-sorting protein